MARIRIATLNDLKMFSADVGTNSNSTLYSVHVKIYVYLLGVRHTVPRAVSCENIIYFGMFIHVLQTDTRNLDVIYTVDVSF